jgi:V/A-type H+/Na+-transporting ATPase subunit I
MAFLRPLPMAKIGVIGLKDDREVLVGALHDLRLLQVEPLGKEALAEIEAERAPEVQRSVSDQLLRIRGLRVALPRRPPGPPRAFPDLDTILAEARAVPLDDEVGRLKREEDQLLTGRAGLSETLALLERFDFYREPFEVLQSKSLLAFFGVAPSAVFRSVEAEVEAASPTSHLVSQAYDDEVRFLLAVPRDRAETVGRLAQQHGVKLLPAPALTGTSAEEGPRLSGERAGVDRRLAQIATRLGEIADEWYPSLVHLEEGLSIENRKLEAYPRMGAGNAVFALEGWVRARDKDRIARHVEAVTLGRAFVYDIATHEEPPTVMENPRGVRWFEFFVRFYSLPESTEFDPTWIFAIFFPILFGVMIGDVGYGSVILGFCVWMIAGFPGGSKLPNFLKSFPKMVMPPAAMRDLAYALTPGCLIAIAMGVLGNEFFGGHLNYTPVLDPLRTTGKLLLFSGILGLLMVVLGYALSATKEYFHHRPRHAVAKVGAISAALGLALFGLSLIRGTDTPANAIWTYLELGGLLGGIVVVLVGAGVMEGMLTFIELLSHILSYTRIVGILLASVILALVINTIGLGMLSSPLAGLGVVYILFGILLIVVGQVFTLILAVFEPSIQGMRLMYVEHFSKFFEGGGKPFRPFGSPRVHTVATRADSSGAP